MEIAVLALGCFWGPEIKFGKLEGITKTEVGDNEDLTATSSSTDTVNNVIQSTVAEGYLVTKSEIFITRNKSYRAYVLIEVNKSAFGI